MRNMTLLSPFPGFSLEGVASYLPRTETFKLNNDGYLYNFTVTTGLNQKIRDWFGFQLGTLEELLLLNNFK